MTTLVLFPQLEKSRRYRYTEEAKVVYQAIELYLIENPQNDMGSFSMNMLQYPLDDSRNVLNGELSGGFSEGARIVRMSVSKREGKITALVYKVKGYQVEIRNGMVDECVKLKKK